MQYQHDRDSNNEKNTEEENISHFQSVYDISSMKGGDSTKKIIYFLCCKEMADGEVIFTVRKVGSGNNKRICLECYEYLIMAQSDIKAVEDARENFCDTELDDNSHSPPDLPDPGPLALVPDPPSLPGGGGLRRED